MYRIDWRKIVGIKDIIKKQKDGIKKTFYTFTVSEKDFFEYKFNTIEWEQTIEIINWEHDWIKKEYTIIFDEIGKGR